MKKYFYLILIGIFIILSVIILNISVSTQQCINYECRTIRLPLYLKAINFFDRHYNYKYLVKRIVGDAKTDEQRVMKIFEWTYKSIRRVPAGLPVIDDHIWHTIVRGYAARDQFSDIFSTLCNYIGVEAFFSDVYAKDRRQRIPLAFAKIKERWFVFDPCLGIYFQDHKGRLADIETIKSNNWVLVSLDEKTRPDIDYAIYLNNLPTIKDIGLGRSNTQSPLNRLFFEIKKHLRH